MCNINWLLFLKIIDGNYEILQSGSNIVPTEEYDKVLPTTEKIARQSDKVYFDGTKLRLKDGETLLSVEELDEQEYGSRENSGKNDAYIFDI